MKIANLAYCGLLCTGCPIQWISRQPDEAKRQRMREEIARIYTEQFGIRLYPEEVTLCDGCKAENGAHFNLSRDCPVRSCARQKKFDTCAQCDSYPCTDLNQIFESDSAAKMRLDVLRSAIDTNK